MEVKLLTLHTPYYVYGSETFNPFIHNTTAVSSQTQHNLFHRPLPSFSTPRIYTLPRPLLRGCVRYMDPNDGLFPSLPETCPVRLSVAVSFALYLRMKFSQLDISCLQP